MEHKREAFNFYRSYYDVLQDIRRPEDKLTYLMALLDRQFRGIEPDLVDIPRLVYNSQKHNIDKQVKGWEDKMKVTLYDPYEPPTEGGSQGGYEGPTDGIEKITPGDSATTTEGGKEGPTEHPSLQEQEKEKEELSLSEKAYRGIEGGTTPNGLSPTSSIPDIKDGGWERVYSLFPESKRKDCNNALIVWSGLPQSEKKQVIRHLSVYVKNTELKFMKQINNYFNEGLWKKMKPEGSTKNEIGTVGNTGFISFNLINFWKEVGGFNTWDEAHSDFVKLDDESKKIIEKKYQDEIRQRNKVK